MHPVPHLHNALHLLNGFPGGLVVKNPPATAGDTETLVQSLGWEDPLEGGHDNPLQYFCLENPKDRGAWWATVYRVAKSRTRLSDFTQSQAGAAVE